MDNGILNNLQVGKTRWFSDLVDTAKISEARLSEPYKVARVVSYVFTQFDNGYSTSLDAITGGVGNVMVIDKQEYEWDVVMDTDRAVTIHWAKWEGQDINASNYQTILAGAGHTPILIAVEDKWFGPGAVIELDDRRYKLRVSGEPYQDGNLFVYTAYITDGQAASYVPGEFLLPGCQVSRLASAYEEYSEEADILNYNTNFKMRSFLSTVRISADITGHAYSEVMVIALKDPKSGKTSYLWADYQEWLLLREWYKRLERLMVYSTSNRNADGTFSLKGTNGRPVPMFAGVLQQIAPSNRRYYTELTAELLEDFLFDMSYNVLGTNERKFVALTGEMGMREFDRVLKEKAATMNMIDTKFVTGSGQNLTLGGQFQTYQMTGGIELTVKHFPVYDDRVHNRLLHPISGKPIESYRFTFLDCGRRDGEANIVKVVRKDRELVLWNTAGSVAPGEGYGKAVSSSRANAKDGYSIHVLGDVSIMIRDPRACGELIMAVA